MLNAHDLVGGQVVEYYKQAWISFEVSNAKEQGERIQDFVGHKLGKAWKSVLEFKVRSCFVLCSIISYYFHKIIKMDKRWNTCYLK